MKYETRKELARNLTKNMITLCTKYMRHEVWRNELCEEGQTITRGGMHYARNSDRLYFCRRRAGGQASAGGLKGTAI